MKTFVETDNKYLSVCISSNTNYVSANVFNDSFASIGTYDLENVTLGIFKKQVALSAGLYYVYYYFWEDIGKTISSYTYSPCEEIIRVVVNSDLKIDELYKLQGLDSLNPMTVTETSRVVGTITQSLTGDGITNTTITRVVADTNKYLTTQNGNQLITQTGNTLIGR